MYAYFLVNLKIFFLWSKERNSNEFLFHQNSMEKIYRKKKFLNFINECLCKYNSIFRYDSLVFSLPYFLYTLKQFRFSWKKTQFGIKKVKALLKKSVWIETSSEFLKMPSQIHVRGVLNSIDNISKVFFLSPFKSISKLNALPTWRLPSFWGIWTLAGFFTHITFHLIYVAQNDNVDSRPKSVTVFIDMYNKYCGLLVNGTLVLIGYFQQANIAKIHLQFDEIEDIFLKQLKIKIKNLNTLRWVLKAFD